MCIYLIFYLAARVVPLRDLHIPWKTDNSTDRAYLRLAIYSYCVSRLRHFVRAGFYLHLISLFLYPVALLRNACLFAGVQSLHMLLSRSPVKCQSYVGDFTPIDNLEVGRRLWKWIEHSAAPWRRPCGVREISGKPHFHNAVRSDRATHAAQSACII